MMWQGPKKNQNGTLKQSAILNLSSLSNLYSTPKASLDPQRLENMNTTHNSLRVLLVLVFVLHVPM